MSSTDPLVDSTDLDPLEREKLDLVKADYRLRNLARRAAVDDATRVHFARRLATIGPNLVQAFVGSVTAPVVSVYSAIQNEPDPSALAAVLCANGISLCLPFDLSTGGPLVYRRWSPGDRLAAGPLGITEPVETAAQVEPIILFVPMIAFDRWGHRLGYGVGNVDSTLRALRARRRIFAIGIAFAVQEEFCVPTTALDEPVDVIVTERDLWTCG